MLRAGRRSRWIHPTCMWLLRAVFIILNCSVTTTWHDRASAHAYVVKSYPAANQALSAAPSQVKVWFDEPVQPVYDALAVLDERGQRVDLRDAHIDPADPALLECSLRSGLAKGLYTIDWRVISADGHPVQGVIPFSVGKAAGDGQRVQTASTTEYFPGMDALIVRWMEYLGMAAWFGLSIFWLFIAPEEIRRDARLTGRLQALLRVSWLVLAVSVFLNLPLAVKVGAGVPWREAFNPSLLHTTLTSTSFGTVWLLQAILTLLALPVTSLIRMAPKVSAWLAAVLGAGLLAAKTATSHAAASFHPAIPVVMDLLHLTAAAVWVGGLLGLASLVPGDLSDAIRRFSPWAMTTFGVLFFTGVYAATANIPTAYSFAHTFYGQTLGLKLMLVVAMLALAAFNWWQGHAGESTRAKPVRPALWAEFTVGACVLAATALLTNLPPAMATPGPVNQTQTLSDGVQAQLHITPNVVGMNRFTVLLQNPNGRPVADAAEVTLSFQCQSEDMGVDTVRLRGVAPGKYEVQGMYLTMAGPWHVHLHVLRQTLQDMDADYYIIVGSLP